MFTIILKHGIWMNFVVLRTQILYNSSSLSTGNAVSLSIHFLFKWAIYTLIVATQGIWIYNMDLQN